MVSESYKCILIKDVSSVASMADVSKVDINYLVFVRVATEAATLT